MFVFSNTNNGEEMNLADKPCYPHKANIKGADGFIHEIKGAPPLHKA